MNRPLEKRERSRHQYVHRKTGEIMEEKLITDSLVRLIYSEIRERANFIYRIVTSSHISRLLGFINYDLFLGSRFTGADKFIREQEIDTSEFLDDPSTLDTPRKLFERKIKYWECRPLPKEENAVVAPADSKVLVGSFADTSLLHVKEKFFSYEELIGPRRKKWLDAFSEGDFAVFRLTPEKYHYNHTPVSGIVQDIYEIEGCFHSCNPGAIVSEVTPFSKNRRVVTVFDTDVPGGTGVGLVLMVEVVALMIGQITQCYSEEEYRNPVPLSPGMSVKRGQPKSLYKPGSSVDILIFQKGKIRFWGDILLNRTTTGASNRYSDWLGRPAIETDLDVRSPVALPADS
jgi:phosphatidylserine decarboxylase